MLLQMHYTQPATVFAEDEPACSSRQFWADFSKLSDNVNSSKQPNVTYKVTRETLWIDRRQNSIMDKDELLSPELTTKQDNRIRITLNDVFTILPSHLWACAKDKDLSRGTELHLEIKRRGLTEKDYADALVTMYAKCGELQKAHTLLDLHKCTNQIPWNALIKGYFQQGKCHDVLVCYDDMKQQRLAPSAFTHGLFLKACAMIGAIGKGKQIHDEILSQGLLEHDAGLGGAIVGMYSKCGDLSQAQDVLKKLPCHNNISWSALIAGYAQNGQGEKALHCFEQMEAKGIAPDEATYACVLKICASLGAINKGKKIHDEILKQGLLDGHVVVGNALVSMYAKFGNLTQANDVLEGLPSRNVVSWNALIAGYSQNGKGHQALHCLEQMQAEGLTPNAVTYVCILKACASIGALDKGKNIHDEILRQGLLEGNVVLGNALLGMYVKCGALSQAEDCLQKLVSRNVLSWNMVISGYAQNGQGQQALHCFEKMQADRMAPDAVTFASILKACASTRAINKGIQIHDEILRQGLLKHHVVLGGALVDMYAKCGALPKARDVLETLPSRDVISWSALIAGYTQNGQAQEALSCFELMQLDGIAPNEVTYSCILKACASIGEINKGRQIHEKISMRGLLEHNVVLGGALVDMYAKCGALSQAQSVLNKLTCRDVLSWSALIAGYVQIGQGQEALVCFNQMQAEGIIPNAVTYASVLTACAVTGAIKEGKQIHDAILRQGLLESHVVLGGTLVDMYAKCGALALAQDVLENLPTRDYISWSALIGGYAQEGQVEEAFRCYKQMQDEGIMPDEVTFLCLLNVCSHLGLVEKGQELFDSMEATYSLRPSIECFNCMVDLLGRAGHIGKAVDLIRDMPFAGNAATWNALLSASFKWMDVPVGSWAFQQIVNIDNCDKAAYITMANIYTAAGMHEKADYVKAMRLKNRAWKLPVCL